MADQQAPEIFVPVPPLSLNSVNLVLAGLSEIKIKEGIDTYMLFWQCRQNAILEAQQAQAQAAAIPVEPPIPAPEVIEAMPAPVADPEPVPVPAPVIEPVVSADPAPVVETPVAPV